jgi:hypothetical protein
MAIKVPLTPRGNPCIKGIWTGIDPDELMFNLRENVLEREKRNQ